MISTATDQILLLPAFFIVFLFYTAQEKVLQGRSIYSNSQGTILIPPVILWFFDLVLLISLRSLFLDLVVLIPPQILFLDIVVLIPLLMPLLSSGLSGVLCKHIFAYGALQSAVDLYYCASLACFLLKAEMVGRELEDAFMHIPKYIPRESQLFLGPEIIVRHLGQEM